MSVKSLYAQILEKILDFLIKEFVIYDCLLREC